MCDLIIASMRIQGGNDEVSKEYGELWQVVTFDKLPAQRKCTF